MIVEKKPKMVNMTAGTSIKKENLNAR